MAGYGLSLVARVFLLFADGPGRHHGGARRRPDREGHPDRPARRDDLRRRPTPPTSAGRSGCTGRSTRSERPSAPCWPRWCSGPIPDGYHTVLVMSLGFAFLGVALLGLFVPAATGRAGPPGTGAPRAHRSAGATSPRPSLRPAARRRRRARPAHRRRRLPLPRAARDAAASPRTGSRCCTSAPTSPTCPSPCPFGRLADRVGRARVLVLGHLALAAAYACAAVPLARRRDHRGDPRAARRVLRRHRRRAGRGGRAAGPRAAARQRDRRRPDGRRGRPDAGLDRLRRPLVRRRPRPGAARHGRRAGRRRSRRRCSPCSASTHREAAVR